ncbi:MAG: TonB-dependent siderophore receptor [Pseudomonadales bacterium]
MRNHRNAGPYGRLRIAVLALATALVSSFAFAAEQDTSGIVEEIVVTGELRSQPGENVESVLGFQKSLLELPRSASTISFEQIERFNIKDIDELVALAPGSFTQSFFGVAGGLDVRGTPGETYFRGIRRLDNPGNYPTPIAAADRIDIVRGPASPIFGPSKIGGYLNFEPKSARAGGGQYLAENEGEISYTTGSWDRNVLTAEVGGPGEIAGREFGFYLYGEVEDSGSFYDNSETEQSLLQASFDMDVTDRLRLQWGGMYHNFEGNQIAGWNRLTQELVDDGTYTTGSPVGLDTNGDGSISHDEYNAQLSSPFILLAGFSDLSTAGVLGGLDATQQANLALVNPGTAQLDPENVLVAPDDTLENEAIIVYFDAIYEFDNGIRIKNQLYYEEYDNLNENAYGFAQFHDTWVVEEKLVVSGDFTRGGLKTSWQVSPSLRYTDFEHGDDFINEYFDRRDLTGPSTAVDRRLLSTRSGEDYSSYNVGDYLNLGIAALIDLDWEMGLNITAGVRYDTLDLDATSKDALLLFPSNGGVDFSADDTVDGTSWTFSISYETPWGVRPYVTAAEQATLIAGQGAELDPNDILAEGSFDTSELFEFGIKGSFMDNKLYMALSFYEQERTDRSAQSIVTNQTTNTEGIEFETRWQVTDRFLATFGYSKIEVTNLATEAAGNRFSFIGSDDLPLVPGELLYGGAPVGLVFTDDARRAGMPENIFSLTGTYDFSDKFAAHFSVVDVESVNSGLSGAVELPSYTLVNMGAVYYTDRWQFSFNVKNLTDEEYFRANFPNLFGTTIVLPELPRNYTATMKYLF